jgi:hypothetical protein
MAHRSFIDRLDITRLAISIGNSWDYAPWLEEVSKLQVALDRLNAPWIWDNDKRLVVWTCGGGQTARVCELLSQREYSIVVEDDLPTNDTIADLHAMIHAAGEQYKRSL